MPLSTASTPLSLRFSTYRHYVEEAQGMPQGVEALLHFWPSHKSRQSRFTRNDPLPFWYTILVFSVNIAPVSATNTFEFAKIWSNTKNKGSRYWKLVQTSTGNRRFNFFARLIALWKVTKGLKKGQWSQSKFRGSREQDHIPDF